MKINICALFLLFLLFTGAKGTHAQVKKNIQPVFNASERFELKNTVCSETFNEKQQTFKNIASFTLSLNVIGKDTTGKVIMRAQYIKQNQKTEDIGRDGIIGYNSDAPDEFVNASKTEELRSSNQHIREFKDAMLNKPFTIYFNEKSGSVEVTGVDTLVTEVLKIVPDSDPQSLSGLSQVLKTTLDAAFSYLPGKPVGTGDGWTKNVKVGELDLKLGYNVKSVQADSICILAAGSEVHKEYNLAVSQKGSVSIDARTGLLIRFVLRSEVTPAPGIRVQYLAVKTEQFELTRIQK